MGLGGNKTFVMVSNRGPNFTTPGNRHLAMGGTKGIYPQIMEAFCNSWVCLSSEDLNTGDITSEYKDQLDIVFVDPQLYHQYYFEYVSEQLYPTLLGYPKLRQVHSRDAFDIVMNCLVAQLAKKHAQKDVVICDYHLYNLPKLLPPELAKIFFWFIPILTIDQYDESIREVLYGLNHATELYFFDDVWAQNFINLFHHFMPYQQLRVKVKSLMMGPDDFYEQARQTTRAEYNILLHKAFGVVPRGKHIISVSRMDFVKRLPLLIEGFELYLDNTADNITNLLLFAPHHRPDSSVYKKENKHIKQMVRASRYKDRIFLTHNHTESADLRTIFTYADMFVCPSKHDAMPLTPLEYILANNGKGSVVLSDSLGAYRLLSTITPSFEADNPHALARAVARSISEPQAERTAKIKLMKRIISYSTIQKAITKLQGLQQ